MGISCTWVAISLALAWSISLVSTPKAFAEPMTLDDYIASSITKTIVEGVEKYAEIRQMSQQSTEEYESARIGFYEQLDQGHLGSEQEGRYFEMLNDKDIYYLSFYLNEGYSAMRDRLRLQYMKDGGTNLMNAPEPDVALGARIDNGIHRAEEGAFGSWVQAVRAALGTTQRGAILSSMPTLQTLVAAMAKSSKEYEAYLLVRNKWEFQEWKFRRRLQAPIAKTATELADRYIQYGLRPPIDRKLQAMPEAERAEAESKVRPWLEQIRREIITYESVRVPPVAAIALLSKHGDISADRLEALKKRLANTDKMSPTESLDAIASAVSDEFVYRDKLKYGRPVPPPNMINIRMMLVAEASGSTPAPGTRIEGERTPPPINYVVEAFDVNGGYFLNREALRRGTLDYEPPIPVLQTVEQIQAAQNKPKEDTRRLEAVKSFADNTHQEKRVEGEEAGIGAEADKVGDATTDEKQVLSATAVTQPQPQPQPQAAAGQPVPANFELSGLRVGMSIADADRIIRNQMKVAAVVEQVHPFNKASIFDRRLYASTGGSQRIVIYWHASIPNEIVGASVYAELPDLASPSDVDAILFRQFGPPTKIDGRSRVWTADPEALGRNRCTLQQLNQGTGFEYTEGTIPRGDSATTADDVMGAASETLAVFTFQDPARWQEAALCPTTRVADVTEGSGGRKAYLLIGLVDGKYVIDHLKRAAAGESEKSLATLDAFLTPQPGAPPQSPAKPNAASPAGAAPLVSTLPADATPPFASPALAKKQRDLIAVWPGLAELRQLKPQEYDAALTVVPASNGVTDVNNGISVISVAMDSVIKSALEKLTRLDDENVIDILKSQIDVYQAMESNFGEEFCGRAVQNDLGKFREPSFVLAHFQQYLAIVKGKLDLQRKIISAQESFKSNPSRGAPADADLAGFASQIGLLQTYRGAKQYDKICGALTDFLTKVVEGTDAQAGKARLTTLVSIQ